MTSSVWKINKDRENGKMVRLSTTQFKDFHAPVDGMTRFPLMCDETNMVDDQGDDESDERPQIRINKIDQIN
jgi:hypothetical protein